MSEVKDSRPYVSPRREAAARMTRRVVLDAARACFLEQGYAATTIAQIARRAEVSRPTVHAVGTKAELLKLVRERDLAGDDEPVPVAARPSFTAALAEPDARDVLARFAHHVVQLLVRYADVDEVLTQAAGSDPQLRALWSTSEEQRRTGAGLIVDDLLGKGSLRSGLDRERAIDILWVLMAPDQWRRLRSRGWSSDQYETWLADLMASQLLPPLAARRGS